jgi:glucose-6-phosphate isomerase
MHSSFPVSPPFPVLVDFQTALLGHDARVECSSKTVGELGAVFEDESAQTGMDPDQLVYEVQAWKPVPDGTEGGLFWGSSTVYPGVVGDEYFLTRGHFHARIDRAEYYATVSGSGMLVLMDEERRGWVQEMTAGTTHYIPGGFAHRVVNTGDVPLRFLACWPSDAGYDYKTIAEKGFSLRVLRKDGRPEVIRES